MNDVDDLMALAWVLGQSPVALLMPAGSDTSTVPVLEQRSARACDAWGWTRGVGPLRDNGAIGVDLDNDGMERWRLWTLDNRPDEPNIDHAKVTAALVEHRPEMDALEAADERAERVGVPQQVREVWISQTANKRVMEKRWPKWAAAARAQDAKGTA